MPKNRQVRVEFVCQIVHCVGFLISMESLLLFLIHLFEFSIDDFFICRRCFTRYRDQKRLHRQDCLPWQLLPKLSYTFLQQACEKPW